MDRKYFYLFTILCLALSPLSAVWADDGDKELFPLDGGTTSDGIDIYNVGLNGFQEASTGSALHVESDIDNPKISFDITVPDGVSASLQYKVFLKLSSNEMGVSIGDNSSVSFTVKVDGDRVIYHSDKSYLCFQADDVVIPSGDHYVTLEANFDGEDCTYVGTLDSLYVHIHQFGDMEVASEPICGKAGESHAKCSICHRDSILYMAPEYEEHNLIVESTESKSSCLDNVGQVSKCEHCPYTLISHEGGLTEHDFDANGRCRVCHLSIPRCNADSTVYDVYNAGEMRLLAEMVSLGRISGNIGVNIMADLVFSRDTTMLPLGTFDHPFQGVLNGNGHRIRGIINAYSGSDCLGFVGVAKGTLLSHAVIANLIFDRGNTLQGSACVGGIVGHATDCDIFNCASFGALEGTNYVGGIVGFADKQVSIHNCAAVNAIRTQGTWNTMVCGMPLGHILNSYGAATNILGGVLDELPSTTLRHCYSSQGSGDGLRQVSSAVLASYDMVQLLNEESDSPTFMYSQQDHYPVPVVNSTVKASTNRALPFRRSTVLLRSAMADRRAAEPSEKDAEVEVIGGYVNEQALQRSGRTVDDIMSDDAIQYADADRVYITTRTVPYGYDLYDQISGGEMKDFESWMVPADSSYIALTEYHVNSLKKVKPISQTVLYNSDGEDRIDEYSIDNGNYSLKARISLADEDNIVCQENVDGLMRPSWSIQTEYDETTGKAKATYVYSYNQTTGEAHLEYSGTYDSEGRGRDSKNDTYEEYVDSLANRIHLIYNHCDSVTGQIVSRDDYVLRASDQYLLEIRSETMVDGQPYLSDGMYFIYDDEGAIVQSVCYGLIDEKNPKSGVRPNLYYDYVGVWMANPYPTAIKVPSVGHPSLQKRVDANVYDAQGRVVRRAADGTDPFSGLPRGLYIYQGSKYLKR